ncbi:MAG: hypothetical protein HXY36_06375 [Chloroflexi bacterium]|nr:hypothetical protein [Chloroflexota bacterium]NWF78196.1 hypothetical protein [Chloroflexota bacterium]
MAKVSVNRRGDKVEPEAKRLYDEVIVLKTAIEEAIMNGQKSLPDLKDTPEPRLVSHGDLALTCAKRNSEVVGWPNNL